MTAYENSLKAYRFEGPAWIPCEVIITEQAWLQYTREELGAVVERHPLLFPELDPKAVDTTAMPENPWQRADLHYQDSWGVTWRTTEDGVTGIPLRHPLESWDAFEDLQEPDPAEHNGWGTVDWSGMRRRLERARRVGRCGPVTQLRHGHTFLTLTYLRGFENIIYDMFDEEARLWRLIEMIERFNTRHLQYLLDLNAEIVGFPDDLGGQQSPMISPDLFERYILPSYRRLMGLAREAGRLVHMHSDGHILDLSDMLLDAGVRIFNIQDLVHGIDTLRKELVGRVALHLDIDRQRITVRGNPTEVDELVREEAAKLALPEGGLALRYEFRPPSPIENLDAVCTAMERYSGLREL